MDSFFPLYITYAFVLALGHFLIFSEEKYLIDDLCVLSMYNVLNHANFDLPVSSLSAGNFGQVISTAAPASSAYGAFQGSAVSGRVVVMKAKFDF